MRWSHGNVGIFYGSITILLITPFFVFRDIPLYDLPNHIAQLEIMFGGGAPHANQYYTAEWRLIPNLAAEGWVFLFRHIVSVNLAVRIFLAVTVAQLFWGAVALNRTLFGTPSRFIIVAALFAYNGPLLFGFINSCFGVGMTLWATAAWIRWRERPWALPEFALIGCLILLAHLFAFGVYALVLCSYELGALRYGLKRVCYELVNALHLAVPATLYVAAMVHEVGGTIYYRPALLKVDQLRGMIGFYNPRFDSLSLLNSGPRGGIWGASFADRA